MTEQEYDVAIVGGGPAGLSAALMLGRSTRRVLLVDSMEYRNDASGVSHGFLTQDGTPPAELRRIGREQLAQYPVTIRKDRVVTAGSARAGGFVLQLAQAGLVLARKIVLATGVVDSLPNVRGLPEVYGKSVFLCPYCDAWEVRGQPIGVLGADGADLAMMLRTWSNDVVYFPNGAPLNDSDEVRLREAGILTVRPAVRELRGINGILQRVELVSGTPIPRRALFLRLSGRRQRSDLAHQLGLQITVAEGIVHGERGITPVRGIYVAGDATRDLFFSIIAAAEGASAGVAVNEELYREDSRQWRRT